MLDAQRWAASVMESHLAYPMLAYFRSSHDDQSWVGTLGTLLDAATLMMTTIDGVRDGQARIFYNVGRHATRDLSKYFRVDTIEESVGIERSEFDHACDVSSRPATTFGIATKPGNAFRTCARPTPATQCARALLRDSAAAVDRRPFGDRHAHRTAIASSKSVCRVRTVKELFDVVDRQREADAAFFVEARLGDADDFAGVGDEDGRAALAGNDRQRHLERVLANRREAPGIERGR